MDDLVQFLRDRLDEDEQAARGTTMPLDWHQGPGDDDPEWTSDEMVLMWPPEFHTPYEQDKHWRGLTADPAGLATHIARHDPARVLRDIEAKRQIVDGYALTLHLRDEAATRIKAAGDTPDAEDLDTWDRAQRETGILRDPVALLALPYSDHPGYREDWRP